LRHAKTNPLQTNKQLAHKNGQAADAAWRLETCISSDPQECCALIRQLLQYLKQQDWNESEIFGIHLSMEEAVANAIHHGNAQDRTKSVFIKVEISPERFYARVTDEGCGFDPRKLPDPTAEANREQPSGRGVMLMRCYMDGVTFSPSGNSVELVKQRSK
jgi:serine/threonine-protein kinase RsbW